MTYVYILESVHDRTQRYIGITSDLKRRYLDHNSGRSAHTRKHKPWHLVAYTTFTDEKTGVAFERSLKSGSDRAFLQRDYFRKSAASA